MNGKQLNGGKETMNEEEEGTFVGMHLYRTRKEKEGVGTYCQGDGREGERR